ncbi:MAG: hypothetical protein ACK53Y_08325, partial [bacterium]
GLHDLRQRKKGANGSRRSVHGDGGESVKGSPSGRDGQPHRRPGQRHMAPPKGLRQLAGGGQPHADEVGVPSALHGPGDDPDQAQGLAANRPRQGFAAATQLRTNQGSVSPSDGDFVIGPCRLQRPGTTAGNRQQ